MESVLTFTILELPDVKTNMVLKFFLYFTGPISYLLEAACIISGYLQSWADFTILVVVLIANAVIGFHEEAKAAQQINVLPIFFSFIFFFYYSHRG